VSLSERAVRAPVSVLLSLTPFRSYSSSSGVAAAAGLYGFVVH
jgi:hypothetical protein